MITESTIELDNVRFGGSAKAAARSFRLFIELNLLTPGLVYVVIAITLVGGLIGLIPELRMYRYSLADGMTGRV